MYYSYLMYLAIPQSALEPGNTLSGAGRARPVDEIWTHQYVLVRQYIYNVGLHLDCQWHVGYLTAGGEVKVRVSSTTTPNLYKSASRASSTPAF